MNTADQEMVNLLKGYDLQTLLCVPVVKAEEGSGHGGRLQNCLWSDALDPSSADAKWTASGFVRKLIEDANAELKKGNIHALCSAELAWFRPLLEDGETFQRTGKIGLWMMSEKMLQAPLKHFYLFIGNSVQALEWKRSHELGLFNADVTWTGPDGDTGCFDKLRGLKNTNIFFVLPNDWFRSKFASELPMIIAQTAMGNLVRTIAL